VKVHAALRAAEGVDVAATSVRRERRAGCGCQYAVALRCVAMLVAALLLATHARAVILPEERADVMYHRYEGGGITVDGPSVLVRKNFKETVSVSANYYVDYISSASIDVIASGASRYSEQRNELSVSGLYLYDKSTLSAGYTNSDESDYQADTFYFNVSQDFFGDLTTASFGYTRGQDDVFQNGNDEFAQSIDRQNFRLGVSQIATPNMIVTLDYELITDEGFLNNPYRSYRYLTDPLDPTAGYQLAQEVYPDTRTSDAAAVRVLYYFQERQTIGASYRYFTDDWGIRAHTFGLSYARAWREFWTAEARYRYYMQGAADFYADLFEFESQDDNDWRARDKELSEFSNQTLSLFVSYARPLRANWLDQASVTLQWDHIWFDYDNFTDLRVTDVAPGMEPTYAFEADVYKLIFTLRY
jgi:hypothetical protein